MVDGVSCESRATAAATAAGPVSAAVSDTPPAPGIVPVTGVALATGIGVVFTTVPGSGPAGG